MVTAGTFVALFLGYLVGFAHALWRRAHADYVRTKKSIPALRNNMWSKAWSLTKRAAFMVVVTGLLVWLYFTTGQDT